jgi:ribosomal protein L14E/L6E/L27E
MKTIKRVLLKQGDQRFCYCAGEELITKWQRVWKITKVIYTDKNITAIHLERTIN